jgi:hypothetical protein
VGTQKTGEAFSRMIREFTRFNISKYPERPTAPRVIDFPTHHDKVVDNKKLTEREEIEIIFSYPLKKPTSMKFSFKGGFTLEKFWECVYMGYLVIYNEEPEPEHEHGDGITVGLLNRPETDGKYGIWGHDIDDLFLEGYAEVKPGVFELAMGS